MGSTVPQTSPRGERRQPLEVAAKAFLATVATLVLLSWLLAGVGIGA